MAALRNASGPDPRPCVRSTEPFRDDADVHALSAHHHVALTVSNRDRSADWYARVLGFRELFREESDERRACVMQFAGGGYSVGLVEHSANERASFAPTRIGLDHLAFTVSSRSGLVDWARRLDGHGIENSGVVDVPPGAVLNFKDPDGIALALFWDRAEPNESHV